MRRIGPGACARVLGACLGMAGAAQAHHSYAPFDRERVLTVTGTVRTWELGNPHAYLWIDAVRKNGKQEIWGMEAPSPSALLRNGWDKYTVKAGDKVTVTLNPLKDGRTGGNLLSLTLADGRTLDTRPNVEPPSNPPKQETR
ncbi:MAG TPA: DUF6152 family protein [Steroidobacteraceae bacterium]|nr:DUF6152 family protein [Steroidobacteraceae bacterium]